MRDIKEIMERWGVFHNIQENKTDRIYTFGDRFIEFIGADDHQKLKGAKRKILYCNE
jgi:phage terminase large subunit